MLVTIIESANNVWIKDSQDYMDKSDYDFHKVDKGSDFFAISQNVMKIINLLFLNIKSLYLWSKFY